MRNDIWFRVHYPYGIVLDVANQSFALFNRFYKRLGEGQNVEYEYKTIPELLKFIPNKNISEELKQKLVGLVKMNISSMNCRMYEGGFFKIWFYNDSTNPYAYSKRNVKHYDRYMNILNEISFMLETELAQQVITL